MTDEKCGLIFEAMPKIMAKVGAVHKTKKNQSQNYTFRGFDDVYLAVRTIMAEHGVFATHSIQSFEWKEKETKSGTVMNWLCAVFNVVFWASDGSFIPTQSFGEAMDSGDKSANKAMSMAMKYALVDTFLIPTDEPRDTENDREDEREKAAPKRQEPARPAGAWTGDMIVSFGKNKGKKWSELENGFLVWALENMKPPVRDYVVAEVARRAKAENEDQTIIDAEPVPEPELFP